MEAKTRSGEKKIRGRKEKVKRQQETEKLIRQSAVKLVTSGKKICACVNVCVKKSFEGRSKTASTVVAHILLVQFTTLCLYS